MKIIRVILICLVTIVVYSDNNDLEDQRNQIQVKENDDIVQVFRNKTSEIFNRDVAKFESKGKFYKINITTGAYLNFYKMDVQQSNLVKEHCELILDKPLSSYKYIKIVSSEILLKFNGKSFEKLFKITDKPQLIFEIENKTLYETQYYCISFLEPVKEQTIYIVLTSKKLFNQEQIVFSNGKYEQVPNVQGYFIFQDFYGQGSLPYFKAIAIKQEFDFFSVIKAYSFVNFKDNKSYLQQNVDILLQSSRSFFLISFDVKGVNGEVLNLGDLQVFIKVFDGVLHVLYFSSFHFDFYFFIAKKLIHYNSQKREIKTKFSNINYYMLYTEYTGNKQTSQTLFSTDEQQILEIGNGIYPRYPKIFYTYVNSQLNPSDINIVAVFYFKKQKKQSFQEAKEQNEKFLCYEQFNNQIHYVKNQLIVYDKFIDFQSSAQLDLPKTKHVFSQQDITTRNQLLSYNGTQQFVKSLSNKQTVLYEWNTNKNFIQQIKANIKCSKYTENGTKQFLKQFVSQFVVINDDYQLACALVFCQDNAYEISPFVQFNNYTLNINMIFKDASHLYVQQII